MRDISLHNLHIPQLLQPLLRRHKLIMKLEMLNILRMRELLIRRIRSVEFFEMVNLVFVLDIPVVTRAVAKVWKPHAALAFLDEVHAWDAPRADGVE